MAVLYSDTGFIYKANYYCLRCGTSLENSKARFCPDCYLIVKDKDARDDGKLSQDSGE